jgi:DNA-binding response OmpR family regulator
MKHQNGDTVILLIDDDGDFREYVSDILIASGFKVFTAVDGKKGLSILDNEHIDVVLTDMIMPGKEGVETIMEIVDNFPDVKIIAMSGASSQQIYLDLAQKLGANRILTKPFKKQDLLSAIETVR